MTTKSKGDFYENKAILFLKDNGFYIKDRNFYARKLGEIDIVAVKNRVYHFIEVKSGADFEAIYNITPAKLYKLSRSINYYLKVKSLDVDYCIDAIIFSSDTMEYLENITL
jgi:putative endonuclease